MPGVFSRAARACLLLAVAGLAVPAAVVAQDEKSGGKPGSVAGQAVAEREAFPVAVLRLDKVFKDNAELQNRLKPLKAEAGELDKTIQLRQAEIESTQAKLTRVAQGSAEFEKLQLQLARLRTELALFVNRERASLQTREGHLYLDVYRDVEQVVTAYCKERGIRLVLRHQEGVDATNPNPQTVLAALNRGIVYADDLDITEDIAKLLSERQRADER